jgi:hypothetical protein
MIVGRYPSRNRFWPVSWRMYGFATQFSKGNSREIGWHSHDRIGSANKRVVRTPKPTRGAVRAELGGGEPLVAAVLVGRGEAEVEAHQNRKLTVTVGHVLVALGAGGRNGGAPPLPTDVTQRLRL